MSNLQLQLSIKDSSPEISNLDCEAYTMDEGVSMPFRLETFFISENDYSAANVVGKQAWFKVQQNNLMRTTGGVVIEFRVLNKLDTNTYTYAVVIGPRVALLDRTRQNEVIATDTAYDVRTVIQKTLDGSISTGATITPENRGVTVDFTLHASVLAGDFPRTNITKYNESDFQFFSRTCEHFGIFYIIQAVGSTDSSGNYSVNDSVLVAADNSAFSTCNPSTWIYKPPSTSVGVATAASTDTAVTSLECVARPSLQQFNLRDFSEGAPFSSLLVRSPSEAGIGAVVEYGDNYSSTDEGNKLVAIRAEEAAWQSSVFQCKSTMTSLCAGRAFKLSEHPISSYNTDYIILRARHEAGKQGPLGYSANYPSVPYSNTFTAIKKTQTFRPKRVTPRPVMSGVFNAFVQAAGTTTNNSDGTTTTTPPKRAVLDSSGRYRIGLVYNEAANKSTPGQGSAPVRQVQPYAGSMADSVVSGMHFPLVNNAEVLVGYVNGDPDRPIILGAAFNATNTDPVVQNSSTGNRVRTTGGLLLEMNDGASSTAERYVRFDIPKTVTDAPPSDTSGATPSGTYLRLGGNAADNSAWSGLTYSSSTVSQDGQDNKNTSGTDAVTEKASSSKTSKTKSTVSATSHNQSGLGVLIYSDNDLDVNVQGAGLMKFKLGYTTKTLQGDSIHNVDAGQYKLTTKNGMTMVAGTSDSPADITIHATNTVTTKSDGDTYDWIYGKTTKFTQGESYTIFRGLEQTLKTSISITMQLSAVNTTTLGFNTSLTGGGKWDVILGSSAKMCLIMGDLKMASSDKKITATDFKIANMDTKVLAGPDMKSCFFSLSKERVKLADMDAELKEVANQMLSDKVSVSKKGISSWFVNVKVIA